MAVTSEKRPTPRRRSKEQAVPVRVVKTTRPRRPVPVVAPKVDSTPKFSNAPRVQPTDKDRRTLMWAGVAVAAGIIFVVWIAIVRFDLTRPSNGDTLFGRISQELKDLFSFGQNKNSNVNAADRELNELRERVFPELDENVNQGSFTTINSNGNRNSNSNTNGATNTNSSSNRNSSANSNTSF